jgi:polysaccharide export outer membrane protein
LVALSPYRTEALDVLQVQVVGTLLDQPIDGFYLIEAEGTVDLGPAYGTVRVVRMTIEEVKRAITEQLKQVLMEPVVSVQLARTSGTQQITGTYPVSPDGMINLGQYGMVNVAGSTVSQARQAIQQELAQSFHSLEFAVDLGVYDSKVYYVITEGPGLGDNVMRVPFTGNETLLDAISQVDGLSHPASKKIWVARPAPGGVGCETVLPVDWEAISRGGTGATNYPLIPGDRVFIAEEPITSSGPAEDAPEEQPGEEEISEEPIASSGPAAHLGDALERLLGIGPAAKAALRCEAGASQRGYVPSN